MRKNSILHTTFIYRYGETRERYSQLNPSIIQAQPKSAFNIRHKDIRHRVIASTPVFCSSKWTHSHPQE